MDYLFQIWRQTVVAADAIESSTVHLSANRFNYRPNVFILFKRNERILRERPNFEIVQNEHEAVL